MAPDALDLPFPGRFSARRNRSPTARGRGDGAGTGSARCGSGGRHGRTAADGARRLREGRAVLPRAVHRGGRGSRAGRLRRALIGAPRRGGGRLSRGSSVRLARRHARFRRRGGRHHHTTRDPARPCTRGRRPWRPRDRRQALRSRCGGCSGAGGRRRIGRGRGQRVPQPPLGCRHPDSRGRDLARRPGRALERREPLRSRRARRSRTGAARRSAPGPRRAPG